MTPLEQRPDAPVLLVHAREDIAEDWLAAHVEAAAKAYPGFCVLPLHGLAIDASALRGRDVVIWPWMGAPSQRAQLRPAAGVLARTAKRVRLIAPAADEAIGPAGLNGHDPIAWAAARCELVAATPAEDLEAEWFGGEAEPGPEPDDGHVLADVPIEVTHERVRMPLVSDFAPAPPDMLEDSVFDDPIDIFEAVPVPALAREHLPWAIVDYVFDQSELMGTDPGILGLACLVTLAGCADDAIQVQPKSYEYHWRESARLWGAVVAGPSHKKSPPIKRALAHVKKIDMKLAEEVSERMDFYERERAEYERIKARAKGAPISMEPPQRPKEKCLLVDDATTEAIGKILRDNPRGLLVVRDELSGWFGSMDAYSGAQGKDAAFWLECYEGGPGKVSRITRDAGPIPNKSLCVLGGIQPDPMRKLASRLNEDGLLQRFIIVCPTTAAGLGEDRPPTRGAEDSYTAVVEWILAERGDKDRPVTFSDEARQILVEVTAEVDTIVNRAGTPSRMRVHLGKWQGLFVRLCLLYHLIESAATQQAVAGTEVARGTAETVRGLMIGYLLPHLHAFYTNVLDESSVVEHARWIAGYVLAHGCERITLRDITRAYKPWKRLLPRERTDAMTLLVDSSWLNARGRGWDVNPAVHTAFADTAESERGRRAELIARIRADGEVRRNMNDS